MLLINEIQDVPLTDFKMTLDDLKASLRNLMIVFRSFLSSARVWKQTYLLIPFTRQEEI